MTRTADTHDDECEREHRNRAVRMLNNSRNGADDEQDVSEHGNRNSPDDGGISAKVGIRDIRAEERDDIHPFS